MSFQKHFSENKVIEGIKKGDNEILTYIYKKYYKYVKSFVIRTKGNEDDAKDVFQNTMIAIFKNVNEEGFILSSKFNTYLDSICTRLWYKELRRRGRFLKDGESVFGDEGNYMKIKQTPVKSIETDFEKHIEIAERNAFLEDSLKKISKECRILLRMFTDKVPMRKIAEYFDLKNEAQAKKKKYRCKEKLVEIIKKDKRYNELINKKYTDGELY